ncbi:hypothetical protein [Pseudomonas sp. PD9R]|uniref:hypothetical protein n=1 Tax=Pseudomonas sp. PD9R TaxID=2853534 RepID=UPI001C459AE4|nr:hypothetical protein [Pseudomonas sp. PD9R]MBV6827263.1 hypothetical protein [Pseudomonas sp. PD9R]
MRYNAIFIPDGYVLTTLEIIFLIIISLCLVGGSFYHFYKLVEIPLAPKKVVLESAFVNRNVSGGSKTTSNLYLTVGPGNERYDYVIEASTRDIEHLGFNKSRKLWVAVEQDRRKRFVWGVYDNELTLLIDRQDILQWAKYSNFKNYFIIFSWGFSSLYLLFLLINNGVWNRVLAKRIAHEYRENRQ